MKRIFTALLLLASVCLIFTGCDKKPTVPDLLNIDEETAKASCLQQGLIPVIEYGYKEGAENGKAYEIIPAVGQEISSGSKITIRIQRYAKAKSWECKGVSNVYLEGNNIHIEGLGITSRALGGAKRIHGKANLDGNVKTPGAKLKIKNLRYKKMESTFDVEVPVYGFDDPTPEKLYLFLSYTEDENSQSTQREISIVW